VRRLIFGGDISRDQVEEYGGGWQRYEVKKRSWRERFWWRRVGVRGKELGELRGDAFCRAVSNLWRQRAGIDVMQTHSPFTCRSTPLGYLPLTSANWTSNYTEGRTIVVNAWSKILSDMMRGYATIAGKKPPRPRLRSSTLSLDHVRTDIQFAHQNGTDFATVSSKAAGVGVVERNSEEHIKYAPVS